MFFKENLLEFIGKKATKEVTNNIPTQIKELKEDNTESKMSSQGI